MSLFLFLSSLALLGGGLWLVRVVHAVPDHNDDFGWPQ